MTSFKTLDDLGEMEGKRALVRVDLNVPMQDGAVSDDTRLRSTLPTVTELADKGAIVLLLAHFGRPKGEVRPDMSLALVTRPYEHVLGRPVRFIGEWDKAAVATLAWKPMSDSCSATGSPAALRIAASATSMPATVARVAWVAASEAMCTSRALRTSSRSSRRRGSRRTAAVKKPPIGPALGWATTVRRP